MEMPEVLNGCPVEFLDTREGVCRTPFELPPDPEIRLEPEGAILPVYPGTKGRIWEFNLRLKVNGDSVHHVPVIVIDCDHGKDVLLGRFIFGAEARNQYAVCAATVAKLISGGYFNRFNDELRLLFNDPTNIREHQILRAGKAISLHPFMPDIQCQGDDVKRHAVQNGRMFEGRVVTQHSHGEEMLHVWSEICMATGANLGAFSESYVNFCREHGNGQEKWVLLNSVFISIEGLKRFLPILLEHGIKPIILCWEGIFNIHKEDLVLSSGLTIFAGTLISLYPDSDNKVFLPRSTYEFIERNYPVGLKPDINGEVGEKIEERDIDVTIYDLCEFERLGMLVGHEPWRSKVIRALEKSPGTVSRLHREPALRRVALYLQREGIIIDQSSTIPSQQKIKGVKLY